jgi:hypothetical protein
VSGYDFDQDLSVLEERKGHEADGVEQFENGDYKDCELENGDDVGEEDESERSYAGFDVDTRLRTLDFEDDYGTIGYLSEELISHCKELAE